MMLKDVSALDIFISYASAAISNFNEVRSVIANWYALPLLFLGAGLTLRVRSGSVVRVGSWRAFREYWVSTANVRNLLGGKNAIRIKNRVARIRYKNRELKFRVNDEEALRAAFYQVHEQFVKEQYAWLDVKNKNVVDIGANIGDTAIYFAVNGARHVYAFEPVKKLYLIAKSNSRLNSLSKKITMVNRGCGGGGSGGVTLDEILRRYKVGGGVLKADCEGCEYGLVLGAKSETLRRFGSILLEYHYGYKKLVKKLEESGFSVRHTWPRYFKGMGSSHEMYDGLIFASRKS